MARRYSAFLLRFWRCDDGSQRIQIEHIQAGTRGIVTSPAAALAWLAEHADDVAIARPPEASLSGGVVAPALASTGGDPPPGADEP